MQSPCLLWEPGTDSEMESNEDHEHEDWTAQPQKEMTKAGYCEGVKNHNVHEWVKKASVVCPLC